MNVRRFSGQAGLHYIGLLALFFVVLDSPVLAQPFQPPNPSEQALRNAALDGQIETVRSSLDKGASTDAPDPDGRTALMMAAFNGHTETVNLLLDRGAKINALDGVERTALMYAAAGPYAKTVKLLIERGADLNVTDTEEGFTALMFAAAEGQTEVVKVLLSNGADIKITDKDGDTALDFAEKNGHQEAVRELKKGMQRK
jgi:ankyrin repeat protein